MFLFECKGQDFFFNILPKMTDEMAELEKISGHWMVLDADYS